MISFRRPPCEGLAGAISPPFAARANSVMPRSISPGWRTSIGVSSMRRDGATACIAANCPIPAAKLGSRRTATRVTLGAISLSNSSHFEPMPYSKTLNPVALPPGRARLWTNPAPTGARRTGASAGQDGAGAFPKAQGRGGARRQHGPPAQTATGQDDVGGERGKFGRIFAKAISIRGSPAGFNVDVVAVGPAQLLQALHECHETRLRFGIVCGEIHEHVDAPHAFALLRAPRKRPRNRPAEQRDEVAAVHSITLSARASSVGGMVRSSAFAVLMLMLVTSFVENSTGRSAGLLLLRILSTKSAARR